MDIIIRKMKIEDKEEVLAMMRVFYDSPAVFHTSSDMVLLRDIEDCISELPLIDGFVFEVVEVEDQTAESGKNCASKDRSRELAGYAMTALNYTTEYGGISVWVEDLYIKPEYRREGISSKFLRFIEAEYPQAVRFKLEVEAENETAIATYKKNGYGVSPYIEMTKEIFKDL